jgi:curved DNA-binding protein CbpA
VTTTDHHIERYIDVDLYGVLHITADAGAELIDRAYRVRMIEVHPDRAGAGSTELAAFVNAAGAILRQADARARYDALRAARRVKHDGREGHERQRRLRDLEGNSKRYGTSSSPARSDCRPAR